MARRVLIQPLTCLVGEREEFLEGNGSAFLVSISVGSHPAGATRNLPGSIGVVQLADHWVGPQSGSGYSGTRGCALRNSPGDAFGDCSCNLQAASGTLACRVSAAAVIVWRVDGPDIQ